jgi:putative membrane protein
MTAVSTIAQNLVTHPGHYADGHGWYPFFPFVGFFFFLLLFFLLLGAFGRRRMWGGWGGPYRSGVESAEADLARRFAAGDIDETEYEQRVATLRRLRQR